MKNLKKIGEGMVSEAFIYDDRYILLKGKREDSFDSYKRLKKNMDMLEDKIGSIDIPRQLKVIEPCEEYEFGALTYIGVKGTEPKEKNCSLTVEQKKAVGRKLAEFISEMQTIKFEGDKEEEINIAKTKVKKSLIAIEPYLSKEENQHLEKLAEEYERFLREKDFCLTHGDLQEENLMLNENNELVGIIDFGNMEYYVPEVEFAPMMNYDEIIFGEMLKSYAFPLKVENVMIVNQIRAIRFFKHVLKWSDEAIQAEIEFIRSLLK